MSGQDEDSALVVLRPGSGPAVSPERAGEVPPDAAAVEAVVGWFREQGFTTGPVVGISFAITGETALFERVLGSATVRHEGADAEFGLDAMEGEVARYVEAVVRPRPPDFGPWNP